jgi:hypothetical protein
MKRITTQVFEFDQADLVGLVRQWLFNDLGIRGGMDAKVRFTSLDGRSIIDISSMKTVATVEECDDGNSATSK